MKIIKLIKSFFTKKEAEEPIRRKNIIEPDFIDYDGIGNQGRFLPRKRK